MSNKYLEKIASDSFKDRAAHTAKMVGGAVAGATIFHSAKAGVKYFKNTPRVPGGYDALENVGKTLEGGIKALTNKKTIAASTGIGAGVAALTPSKKN